MVSPATCEMIRVQLDAVRTAYVALRSTWSMFEKDEMDTDFCREFFAPVAKAVSHASTRLEQCFAAIDSLLARGSNEVCTSDLLAVLTRVALVEQRLAAQLQEFADETSADGKFQAAAAIFRHAQQLVLLLDGDGFNSRALYKLGLRNLLLQQSAEDAQRDPTRWQCQVDGVYDVIRFDCPGLPWETDVMAWANVPKEMDDLLGWSALLAEVS